MECIEDERSRSAVTYSMITAIQERCRLAEAPDGMTDNQLMTQAKKGALLTVSICLDTGLRCYFSPNNIECRSTTCNMI